MPRARCRDSGVRARIAAYDQLGGIVLPFNLLCFLMKLHIPVNYICNGLLSWLSHFNISIIEILINHIAFPFPVTY